MGKISDKLQDKDPSQHPDTIKIELAGEELPFFLGRRTFDLVEDHEDDVDFVSILEGGMEAAQGEANPKEKMDQIGRMLWAGFLPFEPDLSYKVVSDQISIGDLPRLAMTIRSEFDKLTELAKEVQDGEAGKKPPTTPDEEIPEAVKSD